MRNLPVVLLRPGEADRVVFGHPWVYEGSVLRLTTPAGDGEVVQVKDHRQRFLGTGFYNSKSRIRVRMLDRERVEVNRDFFRKRIGEALEWRRRHLPYASSFRLVNSESDFLSGLVVDKYEDVLVIQTSSLGMDQRKGMIIEVLKDLLEPRAILERNDMSTRKFEGLQESNEVLLGEIPPETAIRINDLQFNVDLIEGHKTGYYLDQQVNYKLVAEFARGKQVLDCFTFLGGFALHAAHAGAIHVHGIDQSAVAIESAQKNAQINALGDECSFEEANVFDWLKAHTASSPGEKTIPRFDLIILDPPSFTRTRSAIPDAVRGYKEIHLRALKLVKPGGVLATFCCSHHVDAPLFQQVIMEAASDARKILRRVAIYTQSPDHPVLPAIPETEYLKGFAFELAR
jgi:23S rRNA (cytosine1962-C5)-methyltransferase